MAIVRDAAIVAPLFDACRETAAREAAPSWEDRDRDVLEILFQVELRRLGLTRFCPSWETAPEFPFETLVEYAIARSGDGGEARLAEWRKARGEDAEDSNGLVAVVHDFMEGDAEWPLAGGPRPRDLRRQARAERAAPGRSRTLCRPLRQPGGALAPKRRARPATPPRRAAAPVRQWEALAGMLRGVQARRGQAATSIEAARAQGQALFALAAARPFSDVSWDRPDTLCPISLDEAQAFVDGWRTASARYGEAVAGAAKAVEDLRASGRELADAPAADARFRPVGQRVVPRRLRGLAPERSARRRSQQPPCLPPSRH